MLHLTNGDSVVTSWRSVGLPGVYLPWRDVLHDGAVPRRETLEQMSDVRAREIARIGGEADSTAIRAEFAQRDATLASFRDHDEVVLWFEHDLYDQLQLLQILDWFSGQSHGKTALSLICVGSFPGVSPFHGLGQLTPAQIATLLPNRSRANAEPLQ